MLSRKLVGSLGAGVAALGIAAAATPAQAATFTVNNADSSGAGSLRSAISAAEDTQRRDTIVFEIPGDGVHTIALANPLPVISEPLTIRGYTQPGADPATEDAPGEPKIVIDAANVAPGLHIVGDGNEIRGLVIKNSPLEGIRLEGDANIIAGNHIGTNAAGDQARPNTVGVIVSGADNVLGGPDAKDRNVIAGNGAADLDVGGSGHVVEGNRIGTTAKGNAGFNGAYGILVGGSETTVRDNQVGDEGNGIFIVGDDNVVQGNDVGTKASGKRALPNDFGIRVIGDRNLVGGTAEGEGNLASGNRLAGIRLELGATRNDVQGNLIGTTFTGRAPLPNGGLGGMTILGASGNTVGGDEPGAGNVISSNAGNGVYLIDADDNRVLGNWIGTNKTARRDLGNGGSGVLIENGDGNDVGNDDEASPLNTIMHNNDDGVTVESGVENAVVRNLTSGNNDLAIDLGADGSTANDADDLDTGANGLQNGPEIDEVSRTEVDWELETLPDENYRLEFYTCERAGAGEMETYLGSTITRTDANGNADDTTTLPARVAAGDHVAMTASRLRFAGFPPNLVSQPLDTSELSPCEDVE